MQRTLLKICAPFTNSLPKFDHKPTPYKGTSFDQVLAERKQYVPHFNYHLYKEPLFMTEGKAQYLFDYKGNRYQDWISGISTVSVGHSHPELVKAITEQHSKLVHVSSVMLSDVQAQYAKQLCQQLGDGFDSVYFCNSGGEANDFAIHLAKLYTRNRYFLSLKSGYHGLVGAAGNVTNVTNWVSPVTRVSGHEKLSWPSVYRTAHSSLQSLKKDAQQTIISTTTGKVAALLLEPIQGLGGINTYVDGYHKMITDLVRSHGGLIISDEVQSGFARVGKKYWGFKHYDFKPDIVSMAKGIAAGLPLAAVATRREIAQVIDFTYFNTVGGGNVQCTAGMKTMQIIKKEKLAENTETVGNYLLTQLDKMKSRIRILGDTRGVGLMIGMELVKCKQSKEPDLQASIDVLEKIKDRFILIGRGGQFGNVLRLQPPLCMSLEDAKYFLYHFEDILKEYN